MTEIIAQYTPHELADWLFFAVGLLAICTIVFIFERIWKD